MTRRSPEGAFSARDTVPRIPQPAPPVNPDTDRAADLDCAREAYRTFPIHTRPSFGTFAVNFLRERGLELVPAPEPLDGGDDGREGGIR